jgi:hypothetical protein
MGTNIPRVTYPVGGGCGALLLEKQSTNLALQSNAFNTSPWVITNTSGTNPVITANYGISPDGTQNASRIQLARTNTSTSYSQIYQYPISVTNGQPYSWSVWLKSLSGTPTISIVGDFGRPPVTLTSEWVRYTGTGTASSVLSQLEIAILGSAYSSGNSLTADFLAYGYQFEASSYPTSYISTTTSSATRIADECYKTGISNLIGASEGTIFAEIKLSNPLAEGGRLIMQIGSGTNRVYFAKESSTQNIFQLATQSTSGYNFVNTSNYITPIVRMAIAYKNGDNAFYVNGVLVSSASATTNPSNFSELKFGDLTETIINRATLYKTRLTNAELATLTTL